MLVSCFKLIFEDVQKSDVGNLTCEVYEKIKKIDKWVRDELVAVKSVAIEFRGRKQQKSPKVFCNIRTLFEGMWTNL